jgi:hypothetical protein
MLMHDDVEEVLVVGRRPCGIAHPKLKELLVPDFFDLSAIENNSPATTLVSLPRRIIHRYERTGVL